MSILIMMKEGGSLNIDTIGNKPIDEDIDFLPDTDGKLELISTIVADGTATSVAFTSMQEDTYRTHLLTTTAFTSAASSPTGHFNMRLSNNGGSSYISSANYYKINRYGNVTGTDKGLSRYSADTEIEYFVGTDNSSTDKLGWGYTWFNDLGQASQYSQFTQMAGGHNTNNNLDYYAFGGGQLAIAEVHDAMQIYNNRGANITGIFSLYGLKAE